MVKRMIDPAQVSFVPNRGIIENVVLAQEMVHNFSKTKKKKGFLGIKLDFMKAYNKMEWSFLKAVLKAFGFNEKFIDLILQRLILLTLLF